MYHQLSIWHMYFQGGEGQNVELPKCPIDKTEQIMSQNVELVIIYSTGITCL